MPLLAGITKQFVLGFLHFLLRYTSIKILVFFRRAKSEMMPQNPDVSLNVDHIGGLRMAVSTFAGVESRFGLVLPKFEYKTTPSTTSRPTPALTKAS